MFNFWQLTRTFLPIAAVLLLCLTAAPVAEANNGASTSSTQTTKTATPAQQETKQAKATAQKPSQKSVLDAEVLERPLSYFKNPFVPEEEEEDDYTSHSNTVLITVKALIASLLSTII